MIGQIIAFISGFGLGLFFFLSLRAYWQDEVCKGVRK